MKDGTNRKYTSDELAYVIFNELIYTLISYGKRKQTETISLSFN